MVFAVYPTWLATELPEADIPWNRFSHLVIAFALPQPDGSLATDEADADLARLAPLAHAAGRKVVLSIGGAHGYGDAFQRIAGDPALRAIFVENVAAYASLHRLDGVDIDWEYWTRQSVEGAGGNDPHESRLLVELLAALRAGLPENTTLSADVFAGSWAGDQYLPEIQEYVDHVNLMAFDFTGAWPESRVGHHADFATFQRAVNYLVGRGFRADRIVVGLPAYGVEFVDGSSETVRRHSYRDVVARSLSARELARGRVGNTYFETPALIEKKTAYAYDRGLHGVFFFDLSSDAAGDAGLLAAVSRALGVRGCAP